MTEEQPEIIGWRILNEFGEIVASGPVSVAEMASETEQLLEEGVNDGGNEQPSD